MLGSEFNKLKKYVDEHILDFIPEIDPKSVVLYDSMKYSLTSGGKRIRSVLMLAFYKYASGKEELSFALPFAEAIEFIQTYSLIHDDLPALDNDDYRRGNLTNHKVFGEDMAILAGDGLLSAAYEVMLKDCLLYITEADDLKKKVKASYIISKGTGVRGMVQGQVADVENEGKQCSSDLLDYIHSNKTTEFIKSSILAGCYLAGADSQFIEDATLYGECMGQAFQIVDDIMDVISTREERGKDVGGDVESGKNTYPSIYGLEKSKEIAVELLNKASNAIAKYDELIIPMDIISYLRGQIA